MKKKIDSLALRNYYIRMIYLPILLKHYYRELVLKKAEKNCRHIKGQMTGFLSEQG